MHPTLKSAGVSLYLPYTAYPRKYFVIRKKKDKLCNSKFVFYGGDSVTRTRYLYVANVPLYQMSYIPFAYYDYTIFPQKIKHFYQIFSIFLRQE